MIRWTKTTFFWCSGLSLYCVIVAILTSALYLALQQDKPAQPDAFEITPQSEKSLLTLHYSDDGPIPDAGILLPLGPDADKLPGLPDTWQELARLQDEGAFVDKTVGFDALQGIVSLKELAERATFDLPLSYAVNQVFRQGAFVFLLTSQGNVLILDVRQPAAPQVAETIEFTVPIKDMFVHNDIAYCLIASGAGEEVQLVQLDVAQPLKIQEISRHVMPAWSYRLAWTAGHLFVAISSPHLDRDAIHVYTLGNDHTITNLGVLNDINLGATFVCVQQYWFVADANYGMFVLDFSEPLAPREVARLDLAEPLRYLTVAGNRLFAWGGLSRLYSIDISSPSLPQVFYVEEGASLPVQLLFIRQHTYYLDRSGGLKVYPNGPEHASMFFTRRNEKIFRGVILEAADQAGLLQLISENDPPVGSADEILKTIVFPGIEQVVDARWWQGRLLVLSLGGRLSLVQIDQDATRVLSEIVMPGPCHWLVPADQEVYLGGHDQMYTVRADDNRLQLRGNVALNHFDKIYDGVVFSDELLVAAGRSGLLRFSLADPLQPQLISTWQVPRQIASITDAQQLVVCDKRLFVAAGKAGLLTGIIDDNGQLVLTGDLQFESPAKAIEVQAGLAIVATQYAVRVVDVRDINHLQQIGSIDFSGVVDMVASDSGYWAGRVRGRAWTCLPIPRIFLKDKQNPGAENDTDYMLPAMPDVTTYRINLFNAGGRISLPGTYDLQPPARPPQKQGGNHV